MSNDRKDNLDYLKVNKKETQEAYNNQALLRDNPEYKERVNNTLIELYEIFNKKYQKANLDTPILRAKSLKSLKYKVNKLEIERLTYKYIGQNLSQDEKNQLLELMKNKANNEKYNEDIEKIMNDNVKDTKLIDRLMKDKELNGYVKMALLRIARIRFSREIEDIYLRENLIERLDEKYGEKAAQITGKLRNNIMHWENVKKALNSETERKKINNPQEYLKVKDLRAFRFVIANVEDDIETDNENLQECINKRKKASKREKVKCNNECCKALEKVFCNYLATNDELLKNLNLKLIYRKEKDKQNGYYADHLKFCYIDKPEFTFEMQVRSLYVDDISRLDGPAGHKNRPDKEREFIDIDEIKELNISEEEKNKMIIKKVEEMVPEYAIAVKEDGKFKMRDCTLRERFVAFFPGYDEQYPDEYNEIEDNILKYEKLEQETEKKSNTK